MRQGLARWGLTHQVFKSALAASAAYALAYQFVDRQFPVFAPMAALLTIQVTVFNSYSRGVQRILAIIIGVGLALFAFHFTGANWWIIFVVTFAALAIGTRLGLGIAAINQVPMSALLILAARAFVPTYALDRIVDTILGTLVALSVNLLLWPPNSLPKAKAAIGDLRDRTASLLNDAAGLLGGSPTVTPLGLTRDARALDALVGKTLATIETAGQSLKLNPRAKTLTFELERYRVVTGLLERAGVQARGIAKSVVELVEAQYPIPETDGIVSLIRETGQAVAQYTHPQDAARDETRTRLSSFERHYHEVSAHALRTFEQQGNPMWARYGSILSDARHLVEELADRPQAGEAKSPGRRTVGARRSSSEGPRSDSSVPAR